MATKRKAPNGAGSMTFDEKKKLYCFRISVNGKRIPFYSKSEREARKKGLAAQARAMQGDTAISSSMQIKDWALRWVDTYKIKLAARTVQNYKDIINAQIIPNIGKYTFKTIKPIHIQAMINKLVEDDKSKSLVTRVRQLTNSMFEDAADNDLIIKNPCKKIKLPPMSQEDEKKPLTKEEVHALYNLLPHYLTITKPHIPRIIGRMIVIMLKTGVRQEELLALRWEDIDFKNNSMHIVRALDIDKNDPTKPPKSSSSERFIPMHPDVLEQLQAIGIKLEGYIFHTKDGNLLMEGNFRREYRKYLTAAGIEYRSPHITRHTFASDLREAGVDIKTISKLLGHSKVNVSLDVYIHSNDQAAIDAIKKI